MILILIRSYERVMRVMVVLRIRKIPLKIRKWCCDTSGGGGIRVISYEYV